MSTHVEAFEDASRHQRFGIWQEGQIVICGTLQTATAQTTDGSMLAPFSKNTIQSARTGGDTLRIRVSLACRSARGTYWSRDHIASSIQPPPSTLLPS